MFSSLHLRPHGRKWESVQLVHSLGLGVCLVWKNPKGKLPLCTMGVCQVEPRISEPPCLGLDPKARGFVPWEEGYLTTESIAPIGG